MALTLAKIASNTATVTFEFVLRQPDGTSTKEKVTCVYYPAKVTERTFASIEAFTATNQASMAADFREFNEMLANLIKSWDVYEDEAETIMYPLTDAKLSMLPLMFRIELFNAIMGDIRPEALAPTR